MDFKLVGETVRRPDVAFIRAERLRGIDLRRVPLPLAPDLAIEFVSPNDRADDLLLKVSQYLAAGTQAVWLFYPNARQAYRYSAGKLEPEVRSAQLGHAFEEDELSARTLHTIGGDFRGPRRELTAQLAQQVLDFVQEITSLKSGREWPALADD